MGRDVPFDPRATCDDCGAEGAYDFMGDFMCQECTDKYKAERQKELTRPTYRDGIERAAEEIQIVCDRLDKGEFGTVLVEWLKKLPDDPKQPHPESPKPHS